MGTSISIYLDTRAVDAGSPAPLKVAIRRNGKAAYIPLDIKLLPEQWDSKREAAKDHPNAKQISMYVTKKKYEMESALLRLMDSGEIAELDAAQVREKILDIIIPSRRQQAEEEKLFRSRFVRYMNLQGNTNTRDTYQNALRHLDAFDPKLALRRFEDINKDYLQNFEKYMAGHGVNKKNSRNIYLRNVRTVFNDAIDSDITTFYPFRKFRLAPEATKKKALTAAQMQTLARYDCEQCQTEYRDMFLLMFMLRGVNAGDLFLATDKDVLDGRFDYRRNKVGTLFSVKIEPEAQAIINRYKGERHLLRPMDGYKSYKDYLHHMNAGLKAVGRPLGKRGKVEGDGLFPELSSNWARHTWATAASKIDIPKDVISAALGHRHGLTVTDIYIDFDPAKVDDANRKVIDYILYGRDWRETKRASAPSTVCLPEQNEMKENIRSSATA